ncbi:splicing factor [Triplophysa rosa]|uniref:Splicing factor, suppressor of white-apricot homolog n=2 Tax=Triplophysa rosa TaxID=992332 RepID=A0A9W7WC68_TRIRA|nr:splicing factor [Triplophysa rosa]
MHTDLLEEEARQEEEYKRLSEALADEGTYNAVAFRYSADYYDPSQPTEEDEASKGTDQEPQEEEIEEPFVAPPGLVIPSDVELPATTKTHAIIERTANFVCKQGAQFEIVLKAKQARNSQFDFLRFDHYLNPYYKHILKAMKEGRYTPVSESKQDQQQQESKSDDSDYDDDGDGSYLHPSLFASKKSSRLEEIIMPLQVIDPDHPLAVLVRKAQQERNGAAVMATKTVEELQSSTVATQAEYTSDPNVAAMYYGYCMLPDGTYCLAPPPPGIDASVYYTSMSTSTMPIPSVSSPPPPPGTVPFLDPAAAIPSAPATVPVTVTAPASLSHSAPADLPTSSSRPQQTTIAPPATAAAPVAAIIPPPPDIQPVIDKLAEYVARNGVKFETSVRAKNDPRFDFLQSWHQYNSYYEFKKHYFMQKEGLSVQEGSLVYSGGVDSASDCSSDKQLNDGMLIKASFAPICFAIKSKENDMLPLEKNRVRLDDDSDEDGIKGEGQEGAELMMGLVEATRDLPQPVFEEKKPTLSQEELEAKQAKQKLEDRLSAAAREKLAQASKESKERQLQAERKRKAALFLQTLRGPEAEVKRPDETPPEPMVSALPRSTQQATHKQGFDYQETTQTRSVDGQASHLTTSSSSSRGPDRDRERDKKKKKHKRRSRSRSRSRSCSRSKSTTKHSLPSAYRSYRRSRSQSRSPSRRDRRAHSSERKRDEKEKESYGSGAYRLGSNPRRRRSRSRSPHDKRKKSSKSSHRLKGSSCSPSASPDRGGAMARVSASPSPAASPTSSLGRSRDGSQEKDKQVPPTIVSAVQTRITQDLMAKVRAMLAASKGLEPNSS